MKILITGGDGQLGRALAAALRHHRVDAAGRDRIDITDLAAVRAAIARTVPDIVINAAAFTNVDAAQTNQAQAFRVNALGPRNLALAAASAAIPIVHVSTDYVFDGTAGRPYHEYDRPNPLSVYAASKLAGEEAVRELNPRHYVVRTAWLFAADGNNFINRMSAIGGRAPVRVADDEFGSPTYAPHLAQALAALIETGAWGTYHLAGQGGASRFELVAHAFASLGLKTEVVPVPHSEFPAAARRPSYSVLTSIQQPQILLPHWRQGVAEFAEACHTAARR